MNVLDILDGVEIFNVKLATIIKRAVLIGMVLIPSFGSWMLWQAIHREQQAVAPLAAAYSSITEKVMASPAMNPVFTAAPVSSSPAYVLMKGHTYEQK